MANLQNALLLLVSKNVIHSVVIPAHPNADELQACVTKVQAEVRTATFGDATRQLVVWFQLGQNLNAGPSAGTVDAATAKALNNALNKMGAPPTPTSTVSGRVYRTSGPGTGGLHIRVIDRNIGNDVTLAEDTSDDGGAYIVKYSPAAIANGKTAPDLQVLVTDGAVVLGASDVRYNATAAETLDVVLPATTAGLPTEYDTLVGDIAHHYSGKLADLQESADATGRQDISYLAGKTTWDARAVAMAALAERLSARTVPAGVAPAGPAAIGSAWFYALLRAGLPADEADLYRTDVATVSAIWNQAIAQGIIPGRPAQVSDALQGWQRLVAQQSLSATAPTAVSPLKDLLAVSGLTDAQQQEFAALYVANRSDPDALWSAVGQSSAAASATRLQVDGKLAFLTLNNAPLMTAVRAQNGGTALTDLRRLAANGYHSAKTWQRVLGPTITVPASIPGDTPDAKRANYAEYLGAQLRLSYPTTAVAAMVKSGELPVDSPANVSAFLSQHDAAFHIGSQPVERYIKTNNLQVDPDTVTQIKRIQRIYAATRDDKQLQAVLHHGFDSAYQIAQQDKSTFIQTLAADIGGQDQAAQIYERARHIHNAALNAAIGYLTAQQGITLGTAPLTVNGSSEAGAGQVLRPAPKKAADVPALPAYTTLEQLFVSMDFCACEQCRSVLSPAAYLVDLLQFLDHAPASTGNVNPQQALLARRPDLQHLPLTCENTNTVLPYIDMVNETLEYFVANTGPELSLQGYAGHDTGTVPTEDLMARPRYVMDAAYTKLSTEYFPPPLPFDRNLENLRGLFGAFGTSLAAAMEQLRGTDSLEAGNAPYGWRDILSEQLALSPQEYKILTDADAVGLAPMYGFPAGTADDTVTAALSNANDFARRVNVSYEDLVALLDTRFVNPAGTISLIDPTNSGTLGDFSTTEFRESTGGQTPTSLSVAAFARLARIIRLSDKTGWSVHLTDAAICALYNTDLTPVTADQLSSVASLDVGFRTLLPRLGVAARVLTALGTTAGRALLPLLACWSSIDTTGAESLYQQMFTAATVTADTAFAPDAHGAVLQDPDAKLRDHTETLRAAFHLTADELSAILTALEFDPDAHPDTPLNLVNISAIYRRGWLAQTLGLRVRELLTLLAMTGLDPFTLPDPAQPAISRLIALTAAMKQRHLRPAAALYLIWDQDITGTCAPDRGAGLQLARTLRADFTDIDDQLNTLTDIPETFLTQVYGQATCDTFLGLLDDTFTYDVSFTLDVAPNAPRALPDPITTADPHIGYDDFTHRLTHTGVLTDTTRAALQALANLPAGFSAAVDALFARSQSLVASFFNLHPELKPSYDAYQVSGVPIPQRRLTLLTGLRPVLTAALKRQQSLQRLSTAAATGLDFVTALLDPPPTTPPVYPLHAIDDPTRPVIDDVVALQTPGLTATFYYRPTLTGDVDNTDDNADPLDYAPGDAHPLPANPTPGQAISAIWQGWLEAPAVGDYNIVIDTDPVATVSLTIDGADQILVHNDGSWRNTKVLELTAGRLYEVALSVTNVTHTVRVQWETPKRPLEVIPGRYLYPATTVAHFAATYLRLLKLADLASTLRLGGPEIAHFGVDPAYLIQADGWLNQLPTSSVPKPEVATALLAPLEALLSYAAIKAAMSVHDDRLLAVLSDPAAATATPDAPLFALTHWDPASVTDLLGHFGRHHTTDLATFVVFRQVYDAFTVLSPLGIPAAAAIHACTNTPDPGTVAGFEDALRARVPAAAAANSSTSGIDPAAQPGYTDALAARIQADNDWRSAIRPVNDTLRDRSRNALVAYILQHLSARPETADIGTPDRLFEYFLMDVQMEACMQTSRIRHALSSVQLFIQRCLMNLEPGAVLPAGAAQQWSWMNRYRMWEANRKVFLWPENWLDPELRDDKSSFFKDAESELQQSDVTADSVTVAYLNYLAKLEEVAKLEPCGIYHALATADSDEVFHVVARTAGAHRKYYWRRYEYGAWTPWEQIKLDIEDNPVIPYVWQGRLLLFWLRVIKPAPDKAPVPVPPHTHLNELTTDNIPGQQATQARAVLCWSEYFNGKWQSAKTSDVDRPTVLPGTDVTSFDRRTLRLAVSPEGTALRIYISEHPVRFWRRGSAGDFEWCQIWPGSFLLYNTHSRPQRGDEAVFLGAASPTLPPPASISVPLVPVPPFGRALAGTDDHDLALHYYSSTGSDLTRDILHTEIPFEVAVPRHDLVDSWDTPFLFADSRHAFCVDTTEMPAWVGIFGGYGLTEVTGGVRATAISALALPDAPTPPPKTWPGTDGVATGGTLIDRAAAARLVSEDANLARVLPDTVTVSFGAAVIGPWGARSNNETPH